MFVLGFDIGGTKSAVLLARPERERVVFLERVELPTRGNWQQLLEQLCREAETFMARHAVPKEGCRIGVSCGGPLDSKRGVILSPPNLPGWDEVPITDLLQQRLGMPASLQNDADACALAEWRYGAGRGSSNMVFLTFGTGLGAGLILNGRLYRGANGMAGEVGHIRLAETGPMGYGKAGSFEGFCSGGGIAQIARQLAHELQQKGEKASFATGEISQITAKDVAEAAERGCPDALRVFEISGEYFGKGLSILIDILNPEVIVVGSIYARAGRFLQTAMQRQLALEALPASRAVCKILPAQLGEQIGDYGAVMAAQNDCSTND